MLAVLRGEVSIVVAARREDISAVSIFGVRYLFLVGGQAGARRGPSGAPGPGAAASRFRGLAGRCSSGETRAATVQGPTVMTWGFLTSRRVGTTTRGSVLGLSGESFNGL